MRDATETAIEAIDGVDAPARDGFETVRRFVSTSTTTATTTDPLSLLRRDARGPAVVALQDELLRVGQSLPRFGVDGHSGDELVAAVSAFQMERRLPISGIADTATIAALRATADALPDFGALFADGVLATTIGVGFDEDKNDVAVASRVRQGLHDRGFVALDVDNLGDSDLRARGLDPAQIDRDAQYLTRTFQHEGREVTALVKFIDRDSVGARRQFGEALRDDELVLYTGHGRRGSGPDFDHANSAAGNFVIGAPYENGHYALGANDLDKDRRNTLGDHYQLLFFDTCTSDLYLDDLRARVGNKTSATLDVIAARTELPWSTSSGDVLSVLDGVMNGASLATLRRDLDARNAAAAGSNAFVTDRPGAVVGAAQ